MAVPFQDLITDTDHYNVYWRILEPGLEPPVVDFTKNQLVVLLLGPKAGPAHSLLFKRMENYADKTVLWYDDTPPATPTGSRSWVLQMIPKPSQLPVQVRKIQ